MCITAKGITAVTFDIKKNALLFIREQILDPKDEFEVFSFSLKKYLDPYVLKKPKYVEMTVQDVSEIVGRLEVFTKPISVFSYEDQLWVSACYDHDNSQLYALVSSTNLSLLYRVNFQQVKNLNMECRFQQIITIKSARQLFAANHRQLVACSNTQVCVFSLDENECSDLDYLFVEDSEEKQCKRLIGKNIDIKMDFDSKLHCATSNQSIVALIFGS